MTSDDIKKVQDYATKCIESLEKENYAKVVNGYIGRNDGGQYDMIVQRHAHKIVDKLVSLGYIYTTNHGYGCYDWTFSKEFKI